MCSEFNASRENMDPEDNATDGSPSYPRLFHLCKSTSIEKYGFDYMGVKITKVYENSPASRLGLKRRDTIYEVNGKSVLGADSVRVKELIGNSSQFELKLLVLDDVAIEYYTKQNIPIMGKMEGVVVFKTPADEILPYKNVSLLNKIMNLEKGFARMELAIARLSSDTNTKQNKEQHLSNCLKNEFDTPDSGEEAVEKSEKQNPIDDCQRGCNCKSQVLISRIEQLEQKLQNVVSLNEVVDGWVRVDNYKE